MRSSVARSSLVLAIVLSAMVGVTISLSIDKRLSDTTTSSDPSLDGSQTGFASAGAQVDEQALRFRPSSGFDMSEGTRTPIGVGALRPDNVTTTSAGVSVSFSF